jgi:hypothetical protein
MIKTGDILKDKLNGKTLKVLGVCDEVYFISGMCRHDVTGGSYTLSELQKYFEIPEEKWVPEIRERYYYASVDTRDYYYESCWSDDDVDQIRLQRNLVFKTKEEAIARAKQLLGISE